MDLSFVDYLLLFCYLFLPVLIFGILVFVSIILSNRMGGKNKFIVFFVRFIFVSILVFGLVYYFYYFLTVILIGG